MNSNKTKVKLLWMKGIEMEAPTSKTLVHYVGVALVICAVSVLIHAIRWW
jgi:hypothetical protein